MNPSTIRSVVGISGLALAALGVGLWSIPAGLTFGGAVLFVLALVGELR